MREVVILGVGMHKFGRFPDEPYFNMAQVAIREALRDAGLGWKSIQAAFCGNVYGDTGAGHRTVAQVGLTGIPIVNVENACSSGGSALRLAYQEIAAGIYDIILAFGFEKQERGFIPSTSFTMWERHMGMAIQPAQYALKARKHMAQYGTTARHLAKISVKNHNNACLNPWAHYQVRLSEEDVLTARMICDPLTLYMCCPTSDGASAAVLCSKEKAKQFTAHPVTVAGLALASGIYGRDPVEAFDHMVEMSAQQAYKAAGIGPEDINMVETHEAMASAEIENCENLGICARGEYTKLLDEGKFDLTGKLPVNPSGGLLGRGHPLGATSLAQVAEISLQLRGEVGQRQISNPKVGLGHTTGAGPNSCVIILKK